MLQLVELVLRFESHVGVTLSNFKHNKSKRNQLLRAPSSLGIGTIGCESTRDEVAEIFPSI